ncbi:MAG: RtcB family protein, partial [Moorellaceae bacterium]
FPEAAAIMGLEEGSLTVLIHTGSRGFGHQICTDYTARMAQSAAKYGIRLPSKGLAAAPIDSPEGRDYLAAMACAANFAFANRQLITFLVREAFAEALKRPVEEMGLELVYDVAHNIAKFEEHQGKLLLVHRKGATRALPAGHKENPARYRDIGHPAIIPGSMGTASYVVLGTERIRETFNSVNHGAGRVMSRKKARSSVSLDQFQESLKGVVLRAKNLRSLFDEAPLAYKNIDEVVRTLVDAGLTRPVVRLKPLAVIKGEGEEA